MSRAILALLQGDLQAAWQYHPLFPLLIPIGIGFLAQDHLSERMKKICLWSVIAVFICVYLIRMISQSNPEVVYFRPADGLIGRIIIFAGSLIDKMLLFTVISPWA